MIEERRFPFRTVVTFNTCRDPVSRKLLSVDVFMAILAIARGSFEVHIHHAGFEIRRLMAIDAGRGTVRSEQGKIGAAMIEARQFSPRPGVMAGFATGGFARRSHPLHASCKLPFVGIGVATGAR